MKLGIEITPLTQQPTGIGYYTLHLLSALSALPDCPEICGFSSGLHKPQTADLPISFRRIAVPTRALYRCWRLFNAPKADAFLGGTDIYHAVNYVLPPLKKAAGVLTIHDLAFLAHPEWCSPKIVAPFRDAVTRHARRADRILVPSEATRKDVLRFLDVAPDKIRVTPLAGDPSFFPMPREEAEEQLREHLRLTGGFLLCVGTLEPRKNLPTLLRAFLKTDLPHKLVFVGGHGWGDALQAQVPLSAQDKKRIVFTGYIRDRGLFPALYSAATAFLFPSWHEGFGIPAVEAMACGCPVIASDTSSLPEVAGSAALYAAPGDTDAWARAMEHLCADITLQEDLRQKSLAQAEAFSWEKCALATMRCYKELL